MPALHDLDPAECERLLSRETFGRLGLVTPDGPEIVPVNYAVHAGAIVIRTSPSGVLARHGHGAELVFEVDLVDHDYWSGWSVVARGQGEVVLDSMSRSSGGPRVRPWADGDRSCELRLPWTRLTGRRVGGAR
jgi:uncharacterized protein